MKRILIGGLVFMLSQSPVFSADIFPKMDAFGYTIGDNKPVSGLSPVDNESPINLNTSNDFYFQPKSNELNINFEEYHIITSTNGKKIASIFASKEYADAQQCQDTIKQSKPALKAKYKIPVTEAPDTLNFNPDTSLTSVSLSCADNFLYYTLVDHRLSIK